MADSLQQYSHPPWSFLDFMVCAMSREIIWSSCPGRTFQIRKVPLKSPAGLAVCRCRMRSRSAWLVRAQDEDVPEDDAESRLEALEDRTRRRAKSVPVEEASGLPESAWSDWKEGELLPEKWDELNLLERAAELYMGKRGLLFWLNKFAYAAVIAIVVLWIVFRFVGPQLGLYELRSTLSDVTL